MADVGFSIVMGGKNVQFMGQGFITQPVEETGRDFYRKYVDAKEIYFHIVVGVKTKL